ncbi:MAG: hypothetical protein JWM28_2082 [Chitinophagaceae bacterium]|nr:hypothetical protein [Chitinophagaceae bacterium]
MNRHFISLFLCCSVSTAAQKPVGHPAENGVYLSDTGFLHRQLVSPFNKSESPGTSFKSPLAHYNEVWIKTKDSTYKFFDDDIWGYRKKGCDFRMYKNEPYKVDYSGKIVIYTIYSTPGSGSGITIFFSKNLIAPVHFLSKKMLLEVYYPDTTFVRKIKQMKWHESIYKWNKQLNHYEFIDWLK